MCALLICVGNKDWKIFLPKVKISRHFALCVCVWCVRRVLLTWCSLSDAFTVQPSRWVLFARNWLAIGLLHFLRLAMHFSVTDKQIASVCMNTCTHMVFKESVNIYLSHGLFPFPVCSTAQSDNVYLYLNLVEFSLCILHCYENLSSVQHFNAWT